MSDTVDLAAIRERCEKATEGPWTFAEVGGVIRSADMRDRAETWGDAYVEDGKFIAHARTDLPALLALAEAQQREIERWRDALARLNVNNDELLRIRNRCEGVDGDVKIWSLMLQMIVDNVRDLRALAAAQPCGGQAMTEQLGSRLADAIDRHNRCKAELERYVDAGGTHPQSRESDIVYAASDIEEIVLLIVKRKP